MQLKPLRSFNGPLRILFVCHGNICRSPMAEMVMKDLVYSRGLQDLFHIESAATSSEELGNPVHRGTQRVLKAHGIPCESRQARRLRSSDAMDWDLLIGMDARNMRNMERMLPQATGKMHLLLEFAGSNRDVADPWYTGDFETTYEDVCDGCMGLLGYLGF